MIAVTRAAAVESAETVGTETDPGRDPEVGEGEPGVAAEMLPAPGLTAPPWEVGSVCQQPSPARSSKDGHGRGPWPETVPGGTVPHPSLCPCPREGRPLTCLSCSHRLSLGGRTGSSSDMSAADILRGRAE